MDQQNSDLKTSKLGEADVAVVSTNDQFDVEQSKWQRIFRSSLFQIFILGILSFCGPSMDDSITGLGGGGLASPYISNTVNCINYAFGAAVTLFGGVIISKIGIRYACIIGSIAFSINGSAYYCNSKFGTEWYLIFAGVIGGICSGFLYIAESTAMLSYPKPEERGKFLGIWVGCRNLGGIVGGSVGLGNNVKNSGSGSVASSTYLIFIAFEIIGFPAAWLLSPSSKVRRSDGSPVATAATQTLKTEFKMLYRHLTMKRTLLLFLPMVYSFWYGGTLNTYLSLHFSVRARALSSFLTPVCTIVFCFLYGVFILDNRRLNQKQRAWLGGCVYFIPQVACWIWLAVMYKKLYAKPTSFRLDYTSSGWAEAYLPYLVMLVPPFPLVIVLETVTGYFCQMYLYFLLGCFATDVKANGRAGGLFRCFETIGQSISYGINSHVGDKHIPLYINIALCALAIVPQIMVILTVPAFPADHDEVEDEDSDTVVGGHHVDMITKPMPTL